MTPINAAVARGAILRVSFMSWSPPVSTLSKPVVAGLLAMAFFSAVGAARAQVEVRSARKIAETVCAECHKVSAIPAVPAVLDPPAPSFRAIADRPTTTRESLQHFMDHTDWNKHNRPMTIPFMLLAPEERDSLADYILNQRTKPPR